MGNFSRNQKKLEYAYLLTPCGMKSKAMLTAHFLERKAVEYAMLKSEMERYDVNQKHSKRLERDEAIKRSEEAVQ
jgi:hypothetical protein